MLRIRLEVTAPFRCGVFASMILLSEAGRRAGSRSKEHESQEPEPRGGVKARAQRDPRSGLGLDAEHGSGRADPEDFEFERSASTALFTDKQKHENQFFRKFWIHAILIG